MADLLLELFSEEIPARMQAEALQHLQKTLTDRLTKEGFAVANTACTGFVTPRRLTVRMQGLPAETPSFSEEIKGPKVGAPEAALQGFLKKNGLTRQELTERDGVYFALLHKEGKQTAQVLKQAIEELLHSFPWPKSMRWGKGGESWVRPLHSILCVFDGKIVPVRFGTVTAGNTTRGHRFLSPETITIAHSNDYETALEKAFVIADHEKRKACILEQAQRTAAGLGLRLREDAGLLDEVTGLVEWPVVLAGKIDAQFMDLPREVLVSEMRAHQKYFALENADGSLSDHFLITANMDTTDNGKAIVAGNERVLRARLSDGRFFWDQDRKKTLDDWAKGLESVTFHAKLGTVADKVARIKALALRIAPSLTLSPSLTLPRDAGEGTNTSPLPEGRMAREGALCALAERAAALCKADLVTGMVGEFPELQGVMGRYYAQAQGEDFLVADAIADHYKPQGPNDSVPHAPVSICVALADKIDTLASMFAIGEKPTGSKDPFALRRAALGVIRIILENGLRLSLSDVIPAQAGIQTNDELDSGIRRNDEDLLPFFIDRLKVQLKDQGIRHDVINAVVADGDDDLVRVMERAKALQHFLGSEDGANLLVAYRRAANILSIEEKKDKTSYHAANVRSEALKEAPEQALHAALAQAMPQIKARIDDEKFSDAMPMFAQLRAPVDLFFDTIMVNCDDPELRANRLRLLAAIRDSMDSIARFGHIEG